MICKKIMLTNKLGLHARASAKLAQQAGQFSANVRIGLSEEAMVDCKSIMALMMLAAGVGTEMLIHAEGDDEQHAMHAICGLIEDKFGEGE